MAFRTTAALKMHSTVRHGFRSTYDRALHGTCCMACFMEFHSPDRLIQHLKGRNELCGKLVLLNVGSAAPEVVEAARRQAKDDATARKAARLRPPPAIRVPGPVPPWAA